MKLELRVGLELPKPLCSMSLPALRTSSISHLKWTAVIEFESRGRNLLVKFLK
jgi:hypothetical protein